MALNVPKLPTYLTFVIIILMAVVVTFPTSFARPDKVGILGSNKYNQFQPSNVTDTRSCTAGPCLPIVTECGLNCDCDLLTSTCQAYTPPPPPPQSECTPGASCTFLVNECSGSCVCSASFNGVCQSSAP